MRVSPDKNFLGNILRLRLVARETRGRGKDHVLVGAHKRGEVGWRRHPRGRNWHWRNVIHKENTRRAAKLHRHPATPCFSFM